MGNQILASVVSLIICATVESQFGFHGNNPTNFGGGRPTFGGAGRPHSSVGSQPMSFNSGSQNEQKDPCFCQPRSQKCPPGYTQEVHTRIVNVNPADRCNRIDIRCCPDDFNGPIPIGPLVPRTESTGCGSRSPRPVIKGDVTKGEADLGEYPWMVAIFNWEKGFPEYLGGGVLITESKVATVIHIFEKTSFNPALIEIRVGDYNLEDPQRSEKVPHVSTRLVDIKVHPRANLTSLAFDIAILTLQQRVFTNGNTDPTKRTICLPEATQSFEGARCFVSGWGTNLGGEFQIILKEVDVPMVDFARCEIALRNGGLGFNYNLPRSLLCAGEEGKDTCKGDGGSPLVCNESGRWVLVGLVAGGIGCGTSIPGLYVDVAKVLDFILPQIQ